MEKAQVKTTVIAEFWPYNRPELHTVPKPPKVVKPKISATSKIKRTNDNFEKWRKKNAAADLSSILSRK